MLAHWLVVSLLFPQELFSALTMMGHHSDRHCPVAAAMLPASPSCSHCDVLHAAPSLSSAVWDRAAPAPNQETASQPSSLILFLRSHVINTCIEEYHCHNLCTCVYCDSLRVLELPALWVDQCPHLGGPPPSTQPPPVHTRKTLLPTCYIVSTCVYCDY